MFQATIQWVIVTVVLEVPDNHFSPPNIRVSTIKVLHELQLD